MKTFNRLRITKAILFCAATFLQVDLNAQPPIYSFKNPVLVSGTNGQLNAEYRFPNVYTGVDARVRIVKKSGGISLVSIDRTLDGYAEAFQPEYQINSNSNGYFEFMITFVKAGTTLPREQNTVDVSGLDIDGTTLSGKSLREFNRIDMGGGICHFNLDYNEIAVTEIGSAFEATNVTGNLYGTLVDTAASAVMYSVRSYYVDTFYYRVGSYNGLTYSMPRYASLYFKRFTYPNMGVLSATNLESFKGVEEGNHIKLTWHLTEANTATDVILEKQTGDNTFSEVIRYWVNVDGNRERSFSYLDSRTDGKSVRYRLKIVDASGKTGYSNILYFRDSESVTAGKLNVYPTIVNDAVTINCNMPVKETAFVHVMDMSGRMMRRESVSLEKGNNSFRVQGFDRLQRGNYMVVLTTGSMKLSQIVIVR